jgi:predicted TIM-barrel fold metal-dependent hydrolase
MNRRDCLALTLSAATSVLVDRTRFLPIIDTHIHLFDPTRPQGVPWPAKDDQRLYRPAMPGRYRNVTEGLGIVGAIEVECSPWFEDNQWVLDIAAQDPIVVGTIGNLNPERREFCRQLEGLHRNPLFRGIRYGNIWNRSLATGVSNPEVISNLRFLAEADLALDVANPEPQLIAAVVPLTDRIPRLRVVIDHLPALDPPRERSARALLQGALQELAQRREVYVKIAEVVHPGDGQIHYDVDFYHLRLDEIWDRFGANRLLYGSDWPNSDHYAPVREELRVVREYIRRKGTAAEEKLFWRNSVAAYRWVKRAPDQPSSGS